MSPDAASLPDDIDLPKATLVATGAEPEHLWWHVALLRRMAFGLQDRQAEAATAAMRRPPRRGRPPSRIYSRCPSTEVVLEAPCVCPVHGGAMRRMGEDVTEQIDYVPASFRVV